MLLNSLKYIHKCKFSHLTLRGYCSTTENLLLTESSSIVNEPTEMVPIINDNTKKLETRCLYTEVYNINNLELGLARAKSGKSAGLDGEIKATYVTNPKKLEALSNKLKSHQYKPSPSKKV